MTRAFLLGTEPPLGYTYVHEPPYDTVVIGSLTLSQLLHFQEETALQALAEGKPVILYTPGLPEAPKNRALAASLSRLLAHPAEADAMGQANRTKAVEEYGFAPMRQAKPMWRRHAYAEQQTQL